LEQHLYFIGITINNSRMLQDKEDNSEFQQYPKEEGNTTQCYRISILVVSWKFLRVKVP